MWAKTKMYILIFLMASGTPAYLGEYSGLDSCHNAVREIYATQINPPGKRSSEFDKVIDLRMSTQTNYVCIPKKKN